LFISVLYIEVKKRRAITLLFIINNFQDKYQTKRGALLNPPLAQPCTPAQAGDANLGTEQYYWLAVN
jgi:hypothetical protein